MESVKKGLEGKSITINGGDISYHASDDGVSRPMPMPAKIIFFTMMVGPSN